MDQRSVTTLVQDLVARSEPEAAQRLYERYFQQLEWVARGKLAGTRQRVQDAEDVAQTVLAQFFLRVRKGGFPKLADRHDLWHVLLLILDRRVIDQRRRREPVLGESAFGPPADSADSRAPNLGGVVAGAPTAEDIEGLTVELRERLQGLPDSTWRQVAVWKLQQYTNVEIAGRLDCSVRRVERILARIREFWEASEGQRL
jgi:DNA-directed RNA polymerase specialized sigma24 family protein